MDISQNFVAFSEYMNFNKKDPKIFVVPNFLEFWRNSDGFGIVSELLRNPNAVCFSDETLSKLRNTKELWNYSVGILSVGQMASEFFKNSS